ncbi:hypothetical protein CEXT_459761 [Caerostris extrusa]|uniref:Uncharacterized protein n=1 Tax=Caerostris extrusa TaxID=172846 RepID=A0AAV4QR50_CAEEX|nr:hypothetical protein CEXT_459761 [Caerostris extrusa]
MFAIFSFKRGIPSVLQVIDRYSDRCEGGGGAGGMVCRVFFRVHPFIDLFAPKNSVRIFAQLRSELQTSANLLTAPTDGQGKRVALFPTPFSVGTLRSLWREGRDGTY